MATQAPGSDMAVFGPTISRIPICVVGYRGYKTAESLLERLQATPDDERPDTALVIESGAYSGWHGNTAEGEEGLFAFYIDCSFFARNVLIAEPDLAKYMTGG
jgi:hypothetical protein